MKKLCLSLALAVVAILVIVMPVLAAYYAYIYVEESDGNSYESLPAAVSCNTTILIQGDFMTSTALDTRVLTGSGEALPHMVANDKVMFVTDLEAYEKKTLIFYLGATSLSSFPIIVGYNGSFETPDDPDLELGYVMELLISGYFNAETADIGHNILYKDDAFRVWISAEHTLRVAALNSTGDEQWEMHYNGFTTGYHTIYILANGLVAYLYVDAFDVAKDTANLFDATSYLCINKNIITSGKCCYAEGYYWVFYDYDTDNFGYITSADGVSWSGETTIANGGAESIQHSDIQFRDGYVYIAYEGAFGDATDIIMFRRGSLNSTPGVTWSDVWQTVATDGAGTGDNFDQLEIAIDSGGYPYIAYINPDNYQEEGYMTKSSTNDGTWSTAGGYPWQILNYGSANAILREFMYYPASNKLLLIWTYKTYAGVYGGQVARYYNGAAWEPEDDITAYLGNSDHFSMVADEDGNMYIGWDVVTTQYVTVRYSTEVWDTVTVNVAGDLYCPRLSYNENNNVLYIFYGYTTGTDYVYCVTLDTDEMELHTPVPIVPLLSLSLWGVNPYEEKIGFLVYQSPNTYHGFVDLTAYQWNDNGNDWQWNQDNACPYIDDIQVAIDGTLQLEYKPAAIIQGTTLPDEENNFDATITWGANPAGVDTSMSALQFEQSYNETYYYQYLSPGSTDIIKPEPEGMGGDVDLAALHDNPLYPLVQVLTIAGFLTERLVWLGLAWFIVIVAMLLVHLGPDTHKDSEKPQHFILTTITGLGLSILFYTMGIFPLWVIILMAFGMVGAIIWERQPVL